MYESNVIREKLRNRKEYERPKLTSSSKQTSHQHQLEQQRSWQTSNERIILQALNLICTGIEDYFQ